MPAPSSPPTTLTIAARWTLPRMPGRVVERTAVAHAGQRVDADLPGRQSTPADESDGTGWPASTNTNGTTARTWKNSCADASGMAEDSTGRGKRSGSIELKVTRRAGSRPTQDTGANVGP